VSVRRPRTPVRPVVGDFRLTAPLGLLTLPGEVLGLQLGQLPLPDLGPLCPAFRLSATQGPAHQASPAARSAVDDQIVEDRSAARIGRWSREAEERVTRKGVNAAISADRRCRQPATAVPSERFCDV
jgi:hypothetical protein